ncbi:hypothetical protein BZL29_7690 [Mycobacterium kansasii]|uniref:Uncharacterized protein n=1 Tax=Mycobacterium kansasii TaxID=1768 RepID=A0A1V3WEL3_MYCKA|nr:hypothetical protein BZL29_7690 [Mycobacterium kansasii]
MGSFWIEGDDDSGSSWSSRWGSVTDAQADQISAIIESVVGQPDSAC